MERRSIKAGEDRVLTNGEIYGTEIFLADGVDEDDFYEIGMEEYKKILEHEVEDERAY